MGARLMAIVAEGNRGRVYLGADTRGTKKPIADATMPEAWRPDVDTSSQQALATFKTWATTEWRIGLTSSPPAN